MPLGRLWVLSSRPARVWAPANLGDLKPVRPVAQTQSGRGRTGTETTGWRLKIIGSRPEMRMLYFRAPYLLWERPRARRLASLQAAQTEPAGIN